MTQLNLDGQEEEAVYDQGRPGDDFYRTPPWVTRILLDHLPIPVAPARILDAGAGGGAIGRVLEDRWPGAGIWAVEQNADRLELCPDHWTRIPGDMMAWIPSSAGRYGKIGNPDCFDLVVSNPPFSIEGADTWLQWAIRLRLLGRWVAMLGFGNVLGGIERHEKLWRRDPPVLIVYLPKRPRYREDRAGCDPRDTIWVVWGPDRVAPGQTRFVWAR